MPRTTRRIGPVPLALLMAVVSGAAAAGALARPGVAHAVPELACLEANGFFSVGVSEWQNTGPDQFSFVCNYGYSADGSGATFGVGITVEYACPPAAEQRFASVTGDNLVQRDGTISYENETGDFSTYSGDWTLNEKVFWIAEPQTFVTFATYSDEPVWLTAGSDDVGNTLVEQQAADLIASNRQVLPSCTVLPSDTASPTPTPTATTTPDNRPLLPLCNEAIAAITGFGADRLKKAGVDPAKSGLRVGLDDLKQGFSTAIQAYNTAHPDAPAYASPGLPYGSAGALQWLFSEGGVINFVSEKYVTGNETALRNAIKSDSDARAAAGGDPHLAPGDVYRLALELSQGDSTQAMLLSHNTLRSLAREGDVGQTLVPKDLAFYDKYLIKVRDGADNAGPWYHLFGTGYYAMVDDGDYGEALTAGGMTAATLGGGWTVFGVRSLLLLAAAGGAGHLALSNSDVTNALEQLYREQISGRTPDPEKFCYNVWGAVIGGLVYSSLPFKTTRGVSTPFSGFDPPPVVAPPADSLDATIRGEFLNFVQSPVAVQIEQEGATMLFDQGSDLDEVGLYGSVPGWVLPVPEEKGSWGLAWGSAEGKTQTVTMEATQDDAVVEVVRLSGETGQAAVYEFTAAHAGDRYTMTLDDDTVDPDLVAPDGSVIRPARVVTLEDDAATPDGTSDDNAGDGSGGGGPDDTVVGLVLVGLAALLLVIVVAIIVVARRSRTPRY